MLEGCVLMNSEKIPVSDGVVSNSKAVPSLPTLGEKVGTTTVPAFPITEQIASSTR